MRPSLLPRLVNEPFGDPGLFIRFIFENRAVLFDVGDRGSLSTKDLLKLSHIFVTHAHMDHFIGFSHIIRRFLGREKTLTVVGPKGFIQHVEGKLAGYEWNLVNRFNHKFVLVAIEVRTRTVISKTFPCSDKFRPVDTTQSERGPFIVETPAFSVAVDILDHDIPCLGLCIQEPFHINIKKTALLELALRPGPWLQDFKQALFEARDPKSLFQFECGKQRFEFQLGFLADAIAHITPGQKVSYITDVAYHPSNRDKIVSLANHSDHLFIEAHFRNKHADIAAEKHHLTTGQAGRIAALANVKRFTPFHFSPRYTGEAAQIRREVQTSFESVAGRQASK